jgi:selenocysteine lyase/cysteine desulfurase
MADDMHPAFRGRFASRANTYLDTAGYGLPPETTVAVLQEVLESWQRGEADWVRDWDPAGDRCRPFAADLLGSAATNIALIPAVSVGAAVALTGVGPGQEVLLPEDEFASVRFPALVAAQQRGATIRAVPFDDLADEIRPGTAMVLTSQVRSQDGRVQDLERVARAALAVGATTVVDATHAAGLLPVDAARLGLDVVLAAAYKHLLCPRGVAFMHVAEDWHDRLLPLVASWRSAGAPYDHYYGPVLGDLASSAARFDVSLAWHAWLGAEQSLALLGEVPSAERAAWSVGLATSLADQLGARATGSSVISVPLRDGDAARAELKRRRVVVSGRGPRARVSFHLYNGAEDVARAAEALGPFIDRDTAARERG